MKRQVKDGWHSIAGYRVYTVDGYINRGLSRSGEYPVWPYSAGKYDGWDLDQGMTPDTFRRKVKDGSATMI